MVSKEVLLSVPAGGVGMSDSLSGSDIVGAILRFMVSQCRRCRGHGSFLSNYVGEGMVQCPHCQELREVIKVWEQEP